MSQQTMKNPVPARLHPALRALLPVIALAAATALGGCGALKRDHVTVGSVPQDYRTNHPITIAEREAVYDLPVAQDARGLSRAQTEAVRGFMAGYERSSGSDVQVIVPVGTPNAAGAARVAGDLVNLLTRHGVPANRITTYSYEGGAEAASAPVRITYTRLTASTSKCGRWTEDLASSPENRNYADFGCSYQNNLAAQVANPADLLGPRPVGEIDGPRRADVIDKYETGNSGFTPNISY
ncbi:MAG: CpaD family pilus assembly protein [Zhengella sp.]|uniref:CpaD family pilus assembly protein n=1 Tax=Zhengella sp. TaxID=2282762 RepID=UPI0035280590